MCYRFTGSVTGGQYEHNKLENSGTVKAENGGGIIGINGAV